MKTHGPLYKPAKPPLVFGPFSCKINNLAQVRGISNIYVRDLSLVTVP
jgi:hypothetical protein